jgi:UDP-GlcNAc3NAcA epimerase
MKLLTVIGARPQFIKAATLARAVAQRGGVDEVLLHTGQHYDANMSGVFFDELGIPQPAYNLGVGSGHHGAQTAQMLTGIERVILQERPDWLVVYGDTNSTLAGALAASKLHVPVAHVEAGLRSFNRAMPEEINRVVTDHVADLLFAPTQTAADHLAREGIPQEKIVLTGDVMYDAALHFGRKAEAESGVLARHGLERGGYVLATVHRAENTDAPERLAALFDGLAALARTHRVVLPLHPRTRAALERAGRYDDARDARDALGLIEPVGYLDMVMLEKNAALVATDSGGVQKEAFFHGVPCVTLRDETEWVELVEAGWNTLCPPTSARAVVAAARRALTSTPEAAPALYGDGHSAEHILDALTKGHR